MSEVVVKVVNAIEIVEGKKYLLIFDRSSLTLQDASEVAKWLKDQGCESIAVGMGNGVKDMKLVEVAS